MSERSTIVRSLHDLGLAAWFGGSLMGAIGLNGGAATANDPQQRLAVSSAGWARWAPVQLGAIVAHGVGGLGLLWSDKERHFLQPEARVNSIVHTAVLAAAGAVSFYAGLQGARIGKHASEGAIGTTEPGPTSSKELASAQKQQAVLQWAIPALTAVLIVLGAQQGEQQRPKVGVAQNLLKRIKR